MIRYKEFQIKTEEEQEGIIHAVVSVFGNVDSDGDIVEKGAFSKSIKESENRGYFPPGVWSHDRKAPIAKTIRVEEREDGLHIWGKFNLETQRGRESFSDIKEGLVNEYSFAYSNARIEYKDGIRYLKEFDWIEWSPTIRGANRETRTLDVKEEKSNKYFEEDTEYSVASSALRTLTDNLTWNVFYNALWGFDGDDLSQRLDMLSDSLDEYKKLVLKIVGGILANDGDENPEKAANNIRELFSYSSFNKNMTFDLEISQVLAAVERVLDRAKAINDLRQKDGREISEANRDKIKSLADSLVSLAKEDKGIEQYIRFQHIVAQLNLAV